MQPAPVLNHSHCEAFFPLCLNLWLLPLVLPLCLSERTLTQRAMYCFSKCKTAIKIHLCLPFSSLDNLASLHMRHTPCLSVLHGILLDLLQYFDLSILFLPVHEVPVRRFLSASFLCNQLQNSREKGFSGHQCN